MSWGEISGVLLGMVGALFYWGAGMLEEESLYRDAAVILVLSLCGCALAKI